MPTFNHPAIAAVSATGREAALISDLAKTDNLQECAELLNALCCNFEFSGLFLVGDISKFELPLAAPPEWSRDIMSAWLDRGLRLDNPSNHLCRHLAVPFVWGHNAHDWSVPINLDQPRRLVLKAVKESGLLGGVTVPVHLPNGRVGKVEWCWMHDTNKEAFQVLERLQWNLVLASQIAIHKFLAAENKIDPLPDQRRLTARQIECIEWAAKGKTDWETSRILEISYSSVRFHLNNAARRLDVNTKGQMIARATKLGYI